MTRATIGSVSKPKATLDFNCVNVTPTGACETWCKPSSDMVSVGEGSALAGGRYTLTNVDPASVLL